MINPDITLEQLNQQGKDTMVGHLGIVFTEITNGSLTAKMPVDHRTVQPMGLLHGGASVVLAETLGSVGANCTLDQERYFPVGLEINANHIKSAREGYVQGKASPIHIGKKTQVWEIKITNGTGELVCISRITLAILEKNRAK